MPAGGAPVKSTVQGGLHGRPPAGGPAVLGMIGRGVLWLLGSVVAARRGTLVLGIIAGRIFTPGQFGAVAAALVVVLAFRSLGEFGVSRALERYEGDPREIAPAVMTISVVSGAALAAACFAMSSALAGAAGTAGRRSADPGPGLRHPDRRPGRRARGHAAAASAGNPPDHCRPVG